MGILTYRGSQFYLDGKPFTILSGTLHYFRIPKAYWKDRLLKLKECGFNTVETYTCWNLHEPREGVFDFSDGLDVAEFIRNAQELGLNIIFRPGPYICAEWEFGGLPAWLLTYKDMNIRCNDEVFLSKVRRYYKALLEQVRPYFASNGGNIFMLQIENEYGSYGNDKTYLAKIAKIYRENDVDCLFFTSDGASASFQKGSMDGYLSVANFGSKPEYKLGILRGLRPDQPLMCGEYWCGWFDHWFEEHHVRPAEEILSDIAEFVRLNASFNFYMFHGGTNFGFTSGANYGEKYEPTVTSYDYNAPLSEAGDRTETYYKLREMIEREYGKLPPMTASDSKKASYGQVSLTEYAIRFDNLERISTPVETAAPKYMEDLGQNFGYTLYRTKLTGPCDDWQMRIDRVHDRAQIFLDGNFRAVFERWDPAGQERADIRVPLAADQTVEMDILVENMGRVNYGTKLWDQKGIHGVRFGLQHQFGWTSYPLPMEDLSGLEFLPISEDQNGFDQPVFLKGTLEIRDDPRDTFLLPEGFTKGFVMVNGHNLGRYFNPAGPQKTLYVPAPFLKKGENEILVFESDATDRCVVTFTDTPILG